MFFLALAALLLVSLITYNPTDLFITGAKAAKTSNYAGVIGAYLAYGLYTFLGLSAYLLPIFSLSFGIVCFYQSKITINWLTLASGIILIITSCNLFALYFKLPLSLGKITIDLSGGVLGYSITQTVLLPYLNTVGSYLVIVPLFIISLMLYTGLTWSASFRRLAGLGLAVLHIKNSLGSEKSERKKSKKSKSKKTDSPAIITNYLKKKSKKKKDETDLTVPEQPFDPAVYNYPPLALLNIPKRGRKKECMEDLQENAQILLNKLQDFGVTGKVVQIHPGPVITRYEFEPAPGVKINKITNLSDDLALAMRARAVRVVAPIPGKAVVGIEIPNQQRETIWLSEIIGSDNFKRSDSKLTLALGKDISGQPYVTDLAKMPHLLIAGATGSGKSVALNTVICSLLYKASHEDVRMVMLDPKMLELGMYNHIPHLLVPVVTDPKKAALVLKWATNQME